MSKKEFKELSSVISKITPCSHPDFWGPSCLLGACHTSLCPVYSVHISHLSQVYESSREDVSLVCQMSSKDFMSNRHIFLSYLCCELKEVDSEEIPQI